MRKITLLPVLATTILAGAAQAGFYAGAGVGGSSFKAKYETKDGADTTKPAKDSIHVAKNSPMGRIFVGYDHVVRNMLFGADVDYTFDSISETVKTDQSPATNMNIYKVKSSGALGAGVRFGIPMDKFTPYIRAGVERRRVTVDSDFRGTDGTTDHKKSLNFVSPTLGLGFTYAVAKNWGVTSEVRHAFARSQTVSKKNGTEFSSTTIKPAVTSFMIGLRYNF